MAAKLPLIARKNIRDEYDAKVPDLLALLKEYTGEDYQFIVNFQDLYPTLDLSQTYQAEGPGGIAYNTYEGFVDHLKFISREAEGDRMRKDVIDHFNQVVSSRKINILVTDEARSYSDCRIKEGVLEILYKKGSFGTNSSYACTNLEKELDTAYRQTNRGKLPLAAKKGLRDYFLSNKEKLEDKIAEELLGARVSLVVDPEAIWNLALNEYDKLKRNEKSDIDLDSIARDMGFAINNYFEGFLGTINYQFKQDDMMVEAFMDACTAKEIRVVLRPKGEITRPYNDVIFVDGSCIIRTSPQYWGTNASYACEDIAKLL